MMSRWARTAGVALAASAAAAVVVLARSTDWLASFGAGATGERLARMRRSRQWTDGRFRNAEPTRTLMPGGTGRMLAMQLSAGPNRRPLHAIAIERRRRADYETPPASGLRATWIGHATVLLEIGGLRVLTDPVWSERVSPSTVVGPRRFFEPPIALSELPPIDVVLVSHDHYDHLDMATIQALSRRGATFVVPLGLGAHLERWGVSASHVRELDWGERTELAGVTLLSTPARHFSGRGLSNRYGTLWSSWVIANGSHRVFFCGDSGYFDGFERIGREHGPFDLTLISAGAYSPIWPLIHMTPEEVVRAHVELRGGLLVPIHWGTFNLAFHDWNEPAVRLARDARDRSVRYAIPRPGEMVEPESPIEENEWWRQ
jgi:L-ascorbate metabolism protein UlaG (beta-lactamase superfamily)